MINDFRNIPQRIFLDSSVLQTLQDYGAFIYDNESLAAADRIYRDPAGIVKLEALRYLMQVAQRAPFQFALSENSFVEVARKKDDRYLGWAYEILDHWLATLGDAPGTIGGKGAEKLDSHSYNYLGAGDRVLLKDALLLGCDSFLTMENKLPRNAHHIEKTLSLRVLSPVGMWDLLRPWAALFC